MTFRETNTSSQPVTVQDGPSIDGFTVSRDGAVVWRSNAGINPLYIRLVTLQDGSMLVAGNMSADALAERLDIMLPEDRDYATVAGLALAVLRRLPDQLTHIVFDERGNG